MRRNSTAAFTFTEVLITLVLLGLVTAGVIASYGPLREKLDWLSVRRQQRMLNANLEIFRGSGGTLDAGDTAETVLAKLQTPLTDTSLKATNGIQGSLDLRFDLVGYSAADGKARIVWSTDHYDTVTAGAGYRPIRLATPKTLAAMTRVLAGQNFGTTSNWVWEYSGTSAPSSGVAADLSLAGPITIVTPGTYAWTLSSSVSGALTLVLRNGQTFTTTGTTLSQSSAFNYGDNFTFTVFGSLSSEDQSASNSVRRDVTVNIPLAALAVSYAREDGSSSTNFTYAQVSNPSGAPGVRNGIVLTVAGNPTGVGIYYTFDGTTPNTSSALYTGPFHVPLSSWSSGVPLKAVAISSSAGSVSGPVLSLTLTPIAVQLTAPAFLPSPSLPLPEGTPVTVAVSNATTDTSRTEINALPTKHSSRATSFFLPTP